MDFKNVKEGMTLYDVHKHRMGNTTITEWGVWSVKVKRVDADGRGATISWNGNRDHWKPAGYFKRLRAKKPEKCIECNQLVGHRLMCSRRKTRTPTGQSSAT